MTVRETKKHPGKVSRIPAFTSREEEAEFWDTHDITDYLDELTPSTLHATFERAEEITVTIDALTMKRIRAESKREGIDPAILIHIYALEHFQRQDQEQAQAAPDAEPAPSS